MSKTTALLLAFSLATSCLVTLLPAEAGVDGDSFGYTSYMMDSSYQGRYPFTALFNIHGVSVEFSEWVISVSSNLGPPEIQSPKPVSNECSSALIAPAIGILGIVIASGFLLFNENTKKNERITL